MIKRKKLRTVISILLFVIVVVIIAVKTYSIWDEKMRRADRIYNGFEIDGAEYVWVDYKEIGDYTETHKIICKSHDGAWIMYEIKEYPDHEYIVARCGWNGTIMKRVS